VGRGSTSFAQFSYAKPRVRSRAFQDYRRYLDYLRPILGNHQLDQITSLNVKAAYTTIREKVSDHTVIHAHRTLRSALGQAVKWGKLARNPADGASVPPEPRREMCVLTPEEAAHFETDSQAARAAASVSIVRLSPHLCDALARYWREPEGG
jgi:site-specific recombinase XerC